MKTTSLMCALVLVLCGSGFAAQKKPSAEKIIQGPVVEGVGTTSAVIAWTTNTGGSTIVKYGTDQNNLTQTAQARYSDDEKASAQNHRVHLKDLKPGTTYYFVAISGQGEDTGTQDKSAVQHFTTKGAAGKSGAPTGEPLKIIDGPRVEATTATWAVIAWTTNTGGSSVIHYGTEQGNLNQTAQAPYADNEKARAQNHRVRINKLKPNTKYYFIADSAQGEDTGTEAKSPVGEFTTKNR